MLFVSADSGYWTKHMAKNRDELGRGKAQAQGFNNDHHKRLRRKKLEVVLFERAIVRSN